MTETLLPNNSVSDATSEAAIFNRVTITTLNRDFSQPYLQLGSQTSIPMLRLKRLAESSARTAYTFFVDIQKYDLRRVQAVSNTHGENGMSASSGSGPFEWTQVVISPIIKGRSCATEHTSGDKTQKCTNTSPNVIFMVSVLKNATDANGSRDDIGLDCALYDFHETQPCSWCHRFPNITNFYQSNQALSLRREHQEYLTCTETSWLYWISNRGSSVFLTPADDEEAVVRENASPSDAKACIARQGSAGCAAKIASPQESVGRGTSGEAEICPAADKGDNDLLMTGDKAGLPRMERRIIQHRVLDGYGVFLVKDWVLVPR